MIEEQAKMKDDQDAVGVDGMEVDTVMSSGMATRVNDEDEGRAETTQGMSISDDEGPTHIWAPQSKFDSTSRKYARADPWESIRDDVKTMREMREELAELKAKNLELEAKVEESDETIGRMRKTMGKTKMTEECGESNEATKTLKEMDELVNSQLHCQM